ncbi:MAG: SsrA-binding protein [uncultured bacterium]|nr:MAG: SsrA-binding protein [uncultured bacterium]
MNDSDKVINTNRKANFDYTIEQTIECGIILKGTEIKSLRVQGCNLNDSYIKINKSEAWLCQMEIPCYKFGNIENHDPFRLRKLLMHKKEIVFLQDSIERKGLACVPLKIYLKKGLAKVLIGIGKGKKLYDKRQSIKKKDVQKEIDRVKKSVNLRNYK